MQLLEQQIFLGDHYERLIQMLNTAFTDNQKSTDAMSMVSSALSQFGKRGLLTTLKNILRCPASLKKIAERSYLQGNGFYKIVLNEHPAFNLRFHLWLPGVEAQENLHSHRWPFASHITDGMLVSEIWEDSALPFVQLYDEYFYVGKTEQLISVGKSRVERSRQEQHAAGETYVMWPYSLHRVISTENTLTATIMCRAHQSVQWSRNINVNDRIPEVAPRYMTPGELLDVFSTYIQMAGC